jgi:hypothetical protein
MVFVKQGDRGRNAGAQRRRNAGALPQTPLKDFALENPSLGV